MRKILLPPKLLLLCMPPVPWRMPGPVNSISKLGRVKVTTRAMSGARCFHLMCQTNGGVHVRKPIPGHPAGCVFCVVVPGGPDIDKPLICTDEPRCNCNRVPDRVAIQRLLYVTHRSLAVVPPDSSE